MTAEAPAKARTDYDSEELGPFVQRVLQSLVRRAERGDIDALVELRALERVTGAAVVAAARGLHGDPGRYSWGEIGRWLGITRQAAFARFAPKKDGAA